MPFTVSPKVAMYWSIAMVVLGVLSTTALPHYIPSDVGKSVAETAGLLVTIMASIQTAMHGFSAPQAGPLVSSSASDKIIKP